MEIIKQLEDADKTLAADGYKDWCNVRIAISEAIKKLTPNECKHIRTERSGFVDQCRCLDCGKWI